MNRVILLITVCAFAAAMVPRERRALNTEEEQHSTSVIAETTTKAPEIIICAAQTPCAWDVYKTVGTTKYIVNRVNNTYCSCATGMRCLISDDDKNTQTFRRRCRVPTASEEEADEEFDFES